MRWRRPWLRAAFIASMALAGVGLALASHDWGRRRHTANRPSPEVITQRGASQLRPRADDRLAQIPKDLWALKESLSELNAGMERLAAAHATLQVGQQELWHRVASAPANAYWHSDFA